MFCKTIGISLSAAFTLIVVIVIVRTLTLIPRNDVVITCKISDADYIKVTNDVLQRFRSVLQFKTVSTRRAVYNRDQLVFLNNYLRKSFPVIHSSPLVTVETIANYSLLFTVSGSNKSLSPYLLTAHLDVVPANAEEWEYPPFEAQVKDGFINARGTIDDKHSVMSIMESLEYLLANGFKPTRPFYVAFGHDEEVMGQDGARSVGLELQSRGVKQLEFLLDEGLTVTNGFIPGISKPVALIGTSEKGYLTLKLHVKGEAGHSSMPLKETAVSILAKAVAKLHDNPPPSMFGYGSVPKTFEHLAHEMILPLRVVMSNLWLFGPLVSWVMSQKPATNAITRTVTSVTMFNGGVKANVLPSDATAYVNHRIHPAQTVQEILDYDSAVIGDERVQIIIEDAMEAMPCSPSGDEDFGYQTISNSIRQIWTNASTSPALLIGNTDTKHYKMLTKNIYRFSPTVMFPGDEKRFHGINERISIANYEQAINFYYHVIVNADQPSLAPIHKHNDEL